MVDLLPKLIFKGFHTYLYSHKTAPFLLLHILLVSENNNYTNYKKWLEARIELSSLLEDDARNMTLLDEVEIDDNLVAYDNVKKDVQQPTETRILINLALKVRPLTTERKTDLIERKVILLSQLIVKR